MIKFDENNHEDEWQNELAKSLNVSMSVLYRMAETENIKEVNPDSEKEEVVPELTISEVTEEKIFKAKLENVNPDWLYKSEEYPNTPYLNKLINNAVIHAFQVGTNEEKLSYQIEGYLLRNDTDKMELMSYGFYDTEFKEFCHWIIQKVRLLANNG